MNNKGFTLIETLIMISILGLLGIIFANTLAQGLRGQNKTTTISQARQNGQLVLDQISNTLRGADNVVCIGDYGAAINSTMVILTKGVYTRYRFVPPTTGQNGSIVMDHPSTYAPGACSELILNPVTLTNTDPINGVSISNGSFSKSSSAGFKDIVTITFKVFSGVANLGTSENQVAATGVPFSTSVELR
jgi:type II secretory pathway pseudopilin PulG